MPYITSIEVGWIISHIRVAPRQTGKWERGRGRPRIARDGPDSTSVLQQAPVLKNVRNTAVGVPVIRTINSTGAVDGTLNSD